MELTPEEIAKKIVSKLSYYFHNDDMHKPEVLEDASKLIREYGEQQREAGYEKGYNERTNEDEL